MAAHCKFRRRRKPPAKVAQRVVVTGRGQRIDTEAGIASPVHTRKTLQHKERKVIRRRNVVSEAALHVFQAEDQAGVIGSQAADQVLQVALARRHHPRASLAERTFRHPAGIRHTGFGPELNTFAAAFPRMDIQNARAAALESLRKRPFMEFQLVHHVAIKRST